MTGSSVWKIDSIIIYNLVLFILSGNTMFIHDFGDIKTGILIDSIDIHNAKNGWNCELD